MRQDEYDAYTAAREADVARSFGDVLPPEEAEKRARQDTAYFLPQGLATKGHRLLVAENEAGEVVGNVWLGLSEPRTGTTDMAWLYDVNVLPEHRRSGHASAIMREVERMAKEAGATRLGLNVFGANGPAVALYKASGYDVMTQQLAKRLT